MTARTAAFMPCESPPDVNIPMINCFIFLVCFVLPGLGSPWRPLELVLRRDLFLSLAFVELHLNKLISRVVSQQWLSNLLVKEGS